MRRYSLFDFDGTITSKDTLFDFISFTYGKRGLIKCLLLNIFNLALYALKLRSNEKTKEILLSTVIKGTDSVTFEQMCQRYSMTRIPQITKKQTIAIIESHKSNGDTLYIVSASPEDWIRPWALENGFSLVIATKLEKKGGFITGKFSSKNCHGTEKVNRLEEIIKHRENAYIFAYGDSKSDKPMLEYADEGYYIK